MCLWSARYPKKCFCRPRKIVHHCKVAGSNLTCKDDWKTRRQLHSVDLTSTGVSLPGRNIIHLLVARVVYGWWALAYKLIRMPGSIGYVANHAIWRLRGSLDENACFSLLSQAFMLVWLYRCSLKYHPHWRKPAELPKCACEAPGIQKNVFAGHANHLSFFLFQ